MDDVPPSSQLSILMFTLMRRCKIRACPTSISMKILIELDVVVAPSGGEGRVERVIVVVP
jgi:hypothetical protein